jgi:hypothetical protein
MTLLEYNDRLFLGSEGAPKSYPFGGDGGSLSLGRIIPLIV